MSWMVYVLICIPTIHKHCSCCISVYIVPHDCLRQRFDELHGLFICSRTIHQYCCYVLASVVILNPIVYVNKRKSCTVYLFMFILYISIVEVLLLCSSVYCVQPDCLRHGMNDLMLHLFVSLLYLHNYDCHIIVVVVLRRPWCTTRLSTGCHILTSGRRWSRSSASAWWAAPVPA